MDALMTPPPPGSHGRLRLRTLVRLRWLALAGQTLAIFVVHAGLGFPLPLLLLLSIICLSAALNLALQRFFPTALRLSAGGATSLLAFDILQLAALLFLTGGLENPFAFMFLAPVLIAATALEPRSIMFLGALAVAAASLLLFVHQPLPWTHDGSIRIPHLYVMGVFTAILLGLGFISVYAWRVTEEARQLSDAFAATELALTREQNLSAIDGLAAAAAHQLGTPLATIALIVNEMGKLPISDIALKEDIAILRQQADRCREILSGISSMGEEMSGPLAVQSLHHLIDDAAAPYRGFDKAIKIECQGPDPEPSVPRNPGLLYGLGNIIENAVDFSRSTVRIAANWTASEVRIVIEDDGPGFVPEILGRFGDPYLSTRRAGRNMRAVPAGPREPHQDAPIEGGLGLGLFIAKTLIERGGGTVGAVNTGPPSGARVTILWPRLALEGRGKQ
jgi:two-component system, sensor histidine kinase RegB